MPRVVLVADSLPLTCTANNGSPTELRNLAAQYAGGNPKVVTYVLAIAQAGSMADWDTIAGAGGGTPTACSASSALEVPTALQSIHADMKICP